VGSKDSPLCSVDVVLALTVSRPKGLGVLSRWHTEHGLWPNGRPTAGVVFDHRPPEGLDDVVRSDDDDLRMRI